MDYSSLLQPTSTFFFLMLPMLILLGISLRALRKKLPYPPGPKGLPIIGNMNLIDQLDHRGLAKLATQYGGLFHLRLGVLRMVVVSSPSVARQVLQVQDTVFSNRPTSIAIRYLTYDLSDMVFANYGHFFSQMRKIFVMRLLSRKRIESWASVRDKVGYMIHTVGSSKSGVPVNIGDLAHSLTLNITFRAAFGLDNVEDEEKLLPLMHEFSKRAADFNSADFIPLFLRKRWVDLQGVDQRLVKLRNSLDVFFDKIIDEHVAKRKSRSLFDDADVDTDIVDYLLTFYSEEAKRGSESDDSQASIILTRDNIKGIILVSG